MIPAAWAMSCFDPIQTPLTLRALQIAIQSENHCKRLLAIEHLRLLGPAAIELLPVLQKFADDPEEVLELRVASIEAIGEIGRDESRLSPWLLQLLISENLDVAVAVAPILEARGYSARAVLPALRRAIARASSKYQRWLLIRTIIRIDPAEIPRFVPLSDDSGLDYDGPLWAFGTLRLSPFRRPILDHLRKAAHTRADFWVHLTPIAFGPRQPGEHTLGEDSLFDTSVELLRELKPPPGKMIPILIHYLRNGSYPDLPLEFLAAYGGKHYRNHVSSLLPLLNHGSIQIRFQAFCCLCDPALPTATKFRPWMAAFFRELARPNNDPEATAMAFFPPSQGIRLCQWRGR